MRAMQLISRASMPKPPSGSKKQQPLHPPRPANPMPYTTSPTLIYNRKNGLKPSPPTKKASACSPIAQTPKKTSRLLKKNFGNSMSHPHPLHLLHHLRLRRHPHNATTWTDRKQPPEKIGPQAISHRQQRANYWQKRSNRKNSAARNNTGNFHPPISPPDSKRTGKYAAKACLKTQNGY